MSKVFGGAAASKLIALVKGAISTKVDKNDIVDSLDSDDATKVLSAAQGKALNSAISNLNTGSTEPDFMTEDEVEQLWNADMEPNHDEE